MIRSVEWIGTPDRDSRSRCHGADQALRAEERKRLRVACGRVLKLESFDFMFAGLLIGEQKKGQDFD